MQLRGRDRRRLVRCGRFARRRRRGDDVVVGACREAAVGVGEQIGDGRCDGCIGAACSRSSLNLVARRIGASPPRQDDLAAAYDRGESAWCGAARNRIARACQGAVAQLVIRSAPAAIVVVAAFRRYQGREFLAIGRGQALAVDVVVVDQGPFGTHVALARDGKDRVIDAGGLVGGEGHRVVRRPGLDQVALGDVLRSCQDAVVVVSVQVDALVPGHLADVGHQRNAERVVALVASGLLCLPEVAGVDVVDRLRNAAVAETGLEIADRLVELGLVVAQDADGHDRGHAAQLPARIDRERREALAQALMVVRIEDVEHHGLEAGEVRRCPARIGAHDFAGVRELISLDAGSQERVDRAAESRERGRPRIHEPHCLVRVGGVARDLPAQRAGIGGVDVVVQKIEVFGMYAVATAVDHRYRLGYPRLVGVIVGDQPVPAVDPRRSICRDLEAHSIEVGLGMQKAGMHERRARRATRRGSTRSVRR